jgi:hypothetical protein
LFSTLCIGFPVSMPAFFKLFGLRTLILKNCWGSQTTFLYMTYIHQYSVDSKAQI